MAFHRTHEKDKNYHDFGHNFAECLDNYSLQHFGVNVCEEESATTFSIKKKKIAMTMIILSDINVF